VCVLLVRFKEFGAHMLPEGAPVSLIIILPLIEGFSQGIRPLTLMIRLRTNLAAEEKKNDLLKLYNLFFKKLLCT
jgi:F0F1-type ATP synthase membrane subunit a